MDQLAVRTPKKATTAAPKPKKSKDKTGGNLFVRWPMGYICSPSGHVKAKPSKGGYCIVTGASGGIGKELCFDLAKRGYNLILVARSADLLEAMVPELKTVSKDRIQTHVIVADLSKPGAAQALFDAAAALLTPGGGARRLPPQQRWVCHREPL